jgi:hypothetical protein
VRLLEEAMRDPLPARQLRARCEPALIAAIGLDMGERERASKLLTDRLRDARLPLSSKIEMALIALELEEGPGPVTDECVGVIVQALTTEGSNDLRFGWSEHLTKSSGRIDPRTLGRVFLALLERDTTAGPRGVWANGLAVASRHIDPDEAIQLLTGGWLKENDSALATGLESAGTCIRALVIDGPG